MCTTPALALTFTWSPSLIKLTSRPNETVPFSIYIINDAEVEQDFQLRITDVTQKKDGSYEHLDMGSVEYSFARQIKILGTKTLFVPNMLEGKEPVLKPLDEGKFTLTGLEWKEILFEISVPKTKGGYSAGVLCESITPKEIAEEQIPKELREKQEETEEYEAVTEIGFEAPGVILLNVEKRPLKKEAELVGIVERTEDGKGIKIIGSLINTGKGHIVGRRRELRIKRKGGAWSTYPLGSGTGRVMRGSTVDFTSGWEEVMPGEYKADLRIYYGARRPLRIKLPFSVTREGVTGKFARAVDFEVPDVLEKKILPGGKRTFTIPIISYEDDDIHIKARPIGFRFNESGELEVEQEGPLSALSLTTLRPLDKETGECEFDLEPGRWKRVIVEVDFSDLSRDASGGRYVGVQFEGTKEGAEGTTILTSSVLLTMPGEIQRKGEIVGVETIIAEKVEGRFLRAEGTWFMKFIVEFKNTGNIHVSPTGKIVLRKWNEELNEEGGGFDELSEATFEELSVPILPGEARILKAVYSKELELGKYAMGITIEGIDEPLVLEREFIIK